MWWRKKSAEFRGGFQDRDLGRINFRNDFGNDYGIDYARYSDPPDIRFDLMLFDKINEKLHLHFRDEIKDLELLVRNGFVIVKGSVPHADLKKRISQIIFTVSGVQEVINQIHPVHH